MTDAVLDSSAVLALLWREPGSQAVAEVLAAGQCAISAVNLVEVASKLAGRGAHADEISQAVDALQLEIAPFDRGAATAAGVLDLATRRAGLSLGDRAALVLAQSLKVPAYTADRAWLDVALDVDVRLIRPAAP